MSAIVVRRLWSCVRGGGGVQKRVADKWAEGRGDASPIHIRREQIRAELTSYEYLTRIYQGLKHKHTS